MFLYATTTLWTEYLVTHLPIKAAFFLNTHSIHVRRNCSYQQKSLMLDDEFEVIVFYAHI